MPMVDLWVTPLASLVVIERGKQFPSICVQRLLKAGRALVLPRGCRDNIDGEGSLIELYSIS